MSVMAERDVNEPAQSQREQTDESLRVERGNADARAAEKIGAVENEADEIVRLARLRADEVVQAARDEADRLPEAAVAGTSSFERDRREADVALENERTRADTLLKEQRAARRRYFDDFVASERDATDDDLIRERDHSDTVVAARDEFLAIVSHDLRSLLGGLALNADLLKRHAPEGVAGDKLRRHAATGQRLLVRMNRMVNDLLDVVSIEAGQLEVLFEQADVGKLLRDTLDAFEPLASAKGISLLCDMADSPHLATMDGGRILQVLANLVSNAIKFAPAGSQVSIVVAIDKTQIEFAVSDTGIGIAEEALEAVFDRFHQVSKDRRGLGLGLHISKCIVEAHGGKLWAESKLAAGSTFRFVLPSSPLASLEQLRSPVV